MQHMIFSAEYISYTFRPPPFVILIFYAAVLLRFHVAQETTKRFISQDMNRFVIYEVVIIIYFFEGSSGLYGI